MNNPTYSEGINHMNEVLFDVIKIVIAALVIWAITENFKDYVSKQVKKKTPKNKMLKEQSLDHWFLSVMRKASADADAITFEYYPSERVWVMVVGEQYGGGVDPLWRSRDYENITQCWKEFLLFHNEESQ